ncbi:Serine/threonine protein kinase, partial [Phytophthora megakarya]
GKVPQPYMPWGRQQNSVVKHYVVRGILSAQPTTCEVYQWDLVRKMCGFDLEKRIKISIVVDELTRLANNSDKYAVSMYSPPAKFVDLEYIPQLISADRNLLSRLRNASEWK